MGRPERCLERLTKRQLVSTHGPHREVFESMRDIVHECIMAAHLPDEYHECDCYYKWGGGFD